MKDESQSLADKLYWQKVERARPIPPEERMLEGVRMFDRECEAMRLELLQANPALSESEIREEIRRRLAEQKAREDADLYRPVPVSIPPA